MKQTMQWRISSNVCTYAGASGVCHEPMSLQGSRKLQCVYNKILTRLGTTKQWKFIIDLRRHYLKEVMKNKNVEIKHVPLQECRTDLFTKAVDRRRFDELRQMVNVDGILGIEETILRSWGDRQARDSYRKARESLAQGRVGLVA